MHGNEACKIGGTDVEVLLSSHATGGRYTVCQFQTVGGRVWRCIHTNTRMDSYTFWKGSSDSASVKLPSPPRLAHPSLFRAERLLPSIIKARPAADS